MTSAIDAALCIRKGEVAMLELAFQDLLKLPDIRVMHVEQRKTGCYLVTVESTLNYANCRKCGRKITTFHGYDDWITLQHLPICGEKVFLRLRPKLFQCPSCSDKPITTQELSWYRLHSQFTAAVEENLVMV